jgi:hypothetical protein
MAATVFSWLSGISSTGIGLWSAGPPRYGALTGTRVAASKKPVRTMPGSISVVRTPNGSTAAASACARNTVLTVANSWCSTRPALHNRGRHLEAEERLNAEVGPFVRNNGHRMSISAGPDVSMAAGADQGVVQRLST